MRANRAEAQSEFGDGSGKGVSCLYLGINAAVWSAVLEAHRQAAVRRMLQAALIFL